MESTVISYFHKHFVGVFLVPEDMIELPMNPYLDLRLNYF